MQSTRWTRKNFRNKIILKNSILKNGIQNESEKVQNLGRDQRNMEPN